MIKSKAVKNNWSNPSILKFIKNPSSDGYEINIKVPELTFLGEEDQPDFGTVHIIFYPDKSVIELKSLKKYFFDFRNRFISYERLINVIYNDLMSTYKPSRIRLVMTFNPRGGISSKLTIDSDWKIRGGKEQYCDWVGQAEEW